MWKAPALLANIRLGLKGKTVTNALAYSKSFMVHARARMEFENIKSDLKLPFKVFLRPAFFINGLFKLGATIYNAMTFSKMAITIMANLQQLAY